MYNLRVRGIKEKSSHSATSDSVKQSLTEDLQHEKRVNRSRSKIYV